MESTTLTLKGKREYPTRKEGKKNKHHAVWDQHLKRNKENKHQKVKYACSKCEYQTEWKTNVRRHREAIHENIKFSCEQCDYTTSWKQHLNQHNRAIHEKITESCDKCDYKAKWKGNLKAHIKAMHQVGVYKDNIKESTSSIVQFLYPPQQDEGVTKTEHPMQVERITTRKNRYYCTKCNYQTTQSVNLREHSESYHETYSCSLCCHKSTWKIALDWHIRSIHGNKH